MKDFFLNSYMNIIVENNNDLSKSDIEKMKYGIEGIYLTITKLVIIFAFGIILGIVKEILLLLLFYNILRFFGFGYHAKTSKQCLFFSTIFFLLLPFFFVKGFLVFKYKLLILLFCTLNFLVFAPSDTKKRPMINKRKKLIRKVCLIATTLVYSVLIYKVNNDISNIILLSIVIESIMVNPFIYKLTNEPYNNYKSFMQKN